MQMEGPLKRLIAFSRDLGMIMLLIPVLTFILTSICLIFKWGVNDFIVPLAAAGSISFSLRLSEQQTNRFVHSASIIAAAALIALIIYRMNAWFYDISFDGQWYHQDAMIFLKHFGWNPFYDPLLKNNVVSGENADWLNHYAKAGWLTTAAFYETFEKIQIGKSINSMLMLSSLLLSFSFFVKHTRLNLLRAALLALMLALSPAAFGQMFTYYIDGQVSALLLLLVILAIEHLRQPNDYRIFLLFTAVLCYFVNLKFTAAIYGFIILTAAFAWNIAGLGGFAQLKKRLILYGCAGIFAFLLFGYPTYVRNTLEKNHPFYPLMGNKDAGERLAQISYPVDFFDKNRFEKFFSSTFATPQYTSDNTHPSVLKSLFKFKHVEYYLIYFRNFQPVLMSPLGPFYGEFVLLFLPLMLMVIWMNRTNKAFWFLTLTFLVSICMLPDFWIYRYTPQLLFFYALFMGFGLLSERKFISGYSLLLLLVMLLNTGLGNYSNLIYNLKGSLEIHREFGELKDEKLLIRRGWMKSFEYRLRESNLNYTIEATEEKSVTFKNFRTEFSTGWKYAVLSE